MVDAMIPTQASAFKRRPPALIRNAVLFVLTAIALQGCIPLMVGGYIGYKMSQSDAHTQWCAQHVGDPSCHP